MAFRYRQNRKIMARIYTTVTMPRTIASLCSPIDVRSFLNVQKTPSKYSSWTGFSLFTFGWSSWIRTSGMTESKSVALPLGYTPFFRKCCLRQILVYHKSRKKSSVFSPSKKITDFFVDFHRKCQFSLAKSIFLWYNYDNIIANQHVNQRHCPHITRIS